MATYVVGDIQGCYDPLQRLLEKVQFDPAADHLWCPGDLVNRGGESLETLRLLESLGDRFTMTLGNHDLYLLREAWKFPEGGSANREMDMVLLAHDREALVSWLRRQPLAHWSSEHQVLMVHAGVIPQWTLEQTLACAGEVEQVLRSEKFGKFFSKMNRNPVRLWRDERTGWKRRLLISNILTRLRFCDINGKIIPGASGPPGSQPAPYKPWFKHKTRLTRSNTIVFGHWAALGLYLKKRVLGLDSGCVWGGRLSALRLEDRQLFQVPGKFNRHPFF
ncbi:MAG: symmetrical bis(5'-nucleosyl)-tetraphosphatase [Xanthomonadales bacterium]|nr:symmetrical bis(5'-nucleosyl)-tetraphosphatase [Gammaproteobacteria bacterium]MBT8054802.1 symmetrical bis(5'-nucleosyl)-tetraphosphatase [Gammaproteobacteria bacterium]NND56874.1 symmetrical bis(5'-nucleosyl)-tetraphosphatase [Xanthomonadales bacterium]NNK51067.1 symmetrical bis(5'-nucleosyl)-tetraphosphatase [Xanthomonadales bacterium]